MTATLSTEIELAGILIEVEADFDGEYADNSFDHAFGTQHESDPPERDNNDYSSERDLD